MANLTVDDNILKALYAYAERTGKTVEQVVREALERFLKHADDLRPPENRPLEENSLLALSGIGHSGQSDVSERTNQILRDEIDPARGWTYKRDRAD